MAICNRDLDASEQKMELTATFGAVPTGSTLCAVIVPFPCNVLGARMAADGLSGSPTALLQIKRFIVGSGTTTYLGGFTALTLQSVGTSGIQSVVTAATGSTALQLQAGDVLQVLTGAANTAVTSLAVSVVVQATQDIRGNFGL